MNDETVIRAGDYGYSLLRGFGPWAARMTTKHYLNAGGIVRGAGPT